MVGAAKYTQIWVLGLNFLFNRSVLETKYQVGEQHLNSRLKHQAAKAQDESEDVARARRVKAQQQKMILGLEDDRPPLITTCRPEFSNCLNCHMKSPEVNEKMGLHWRLSPCRGARKQRTGRGIQDLSCPWPVA